MNRRWLPLLIGACMLALPAAAAAQEAPAERRNQVALDLSILGAALNYARQVGTGSLVGVELGAAGHFMGSEHFDDPHFATGDLYGFLHGGGFWRRQFGTRLDLDLGLQVGAKIHGGDSGDNVALTLFGGPYAAALVGWRTVKFGPRLLGAYVYEGGDANGFGLIIDPLTARVLFRF